MDEFFNQLQSDMRRPGLSQDAISAAFHAIQQMAETDGEEAAVAAAGPTAISATRICQACGASNNANHKFCAKCGVHLETPVTSAEADLAVPEVTAAAPMDAMQEAMAKHPGQHHYHYHFHQHHFSGQAFSGHAPGFAADSRVGGAARDPGRVRATLGGPSVSRAEAALRRMSQDWCQACNTKQLDDLVELYSVDALVLRPNFPPVRGGAAIREFFFAALEAGLGEVELEALRVEIQGDFAFEAGRCKMLVPVAVNKRREERGKYLVLFARHGQEWKITADCWSSDLSLSASEAAAPVSPGAVPRAPRKP